MIPVPPPDLWTLDAFVDAANDALPGVLPDAPVVRIERTVTPRLVRYLTTQGALSEPHKAGREARYDRRHLLELLVVRRLMALGHTVAAIGSSVRTRSDDENEALLTGAVEIGAPGPAATPVESPAPQAFFAASMSEPPPVAASMDPVSWGAATSVRAKRRGPDRLEESAVDFLRSLDPSAPPSHALPPASAPLPPGLKPSRRPGTFPERWHRAEVLPGVELHMRHDARLPSSPSERDALLRTLIAALEALARR